MIKRFLKLCLDAYGLMKNSEPLIMSSSTAFFATFSISPIFLLLSNLFGLYYSTERMSNLLFGQLAATIGTEAANEIHKIVMNFMRFETSWYINIAAIIFFVFVSTTLLGVVKLNVHKIWRIKKAYTKVRHRFKERAVQTLIILITAVLILVSFIIDSLLAVSLDYLQIVLPAMGIFIVKILNLIFSVIVVTIWFTVLFKYLPEARVEWDVAFNGAFLTAVLYNIGKFALGKILVHARIASIFGASASFALLLLFIFYCSFILYYGAAFTHEYGELADKHICAGKYGREFEERLIHPDV
jgi:membrane protein